MAKGVTLGQKAAVEALGTFLLVFLGGAAIVTSSYFFPTDSSQLLLIAIANGLALGLAVTIAMGISGGSINPAVTIALYVTKHLKGIDAAVYIIAEVIGAVIGAAVFLTLPFSVGAASNWGVLSVSSLVSIPQAILIEALITFVLVIAVFGTVLDKRAPRIAGFGVGIALTLGILFAGPFTGGAANPARALGPEIVTLNFANWYVYWIGPILGALIAALLYEYFILRKK